MADITPDQTLDCTGLVCPEPILKTNMTVKKMEVGKVLEMVGTDLGTKNDIIAWAKRTGNELLDTVEADGKQHYFIKKMK
jgi:tRNA 2-thiouridine synthesizing protein A